MLPTVTFDKNTYTFTLWRDDKKVVHEFKDVSKVRIDSVDEESIALPEDRAKINVPSCGGVFFYIYTEHYNGDYNMVWLSNDEADLLTQMLDTIKNTINYGPEMCARIMMHCCPVCKEGLAGSVYRPRCSVCPWDSQDGDEECDYCHGPVGRCGGRCRDSDFY